MTDTIIPLDNENGQPAYIRLREPDDPGARKATTMRAQQPDGLSEDEWDSLSDYGSDRPESRRAVIVYLAIAVACLAGFLGWLAFG